MLKAALNPGNVYSSSNCCEYVQPLLTEYQEDYPDVKFFLRADSGLAKPELSDQLERNGTSYAIRLKENAILKDIKDSP